MKLEKTYNYICLSLLTVDFNNQSTGSIESENSRVNNMIPKSTKENLIRIIIYGGKSGKNAALDLGLTIILPNF